jgi:hypothetical protein
LNKSEYYETLFYQVSIKSYHHNYAGQANSGQSSKREVTLIEANTGQVRKVGTPAILLY